MRSIDIDRLPADIPPLRPADRLVWLVLAHHAQVAPSVQRITELTGYSSATIFRALGRLEAGGWLVIKRTRGRRNDYELSSPAALEDPPRRGPRPHESERQPAEP